MHETIYTVVMVISFAATAAAPSLYGSNTHKRCYIWKYEPPIHLNACSKSYYFFVQCLRDNAKCLIRIANFPHFSLRSKGQAHSLDCTEYTMRRTTNHSQLSPIFWYAIGHFLHLFVSTFLDFIRQSNENIITIRLQGENTHTHDISQGHTLFYNYHYLCAWCACFLMLILCNVCSFARFSLDFFKQ